jgi:ferredoxin-type protein NapG
MSDKTASSPPAKGKKAPVSKARRDKQRREFLRSAALTAGIVSLSLVGLAPALTGASLRLRPPGAIKTPLDEEKFFAACIKCGQCVQVCPVEAIKLADLLDGVGIGVPYIDPREQACDFSCDGLQCVLACPTGALTHDLDYPADTRMGFAVLKNPTACLAVQGKGFKGVARGPDFPGKLRYDEIDRWNPIPVADHPYDLEICDLCVRQCPIEIRITQCEEKKKQGDEQPKARVAMQVGNECPPKHAIELRPIDNGDGVRRLQPVVLDGCVGCGVCEMICPVGGDEAGSAAIVIDIHQNTDSRRN